MDAVLRGLTVYVLLLVILRISGQRSLGQVTTFDFVLLLIIAETTQEALLNSDQSITNAFLLIITLVGLDVGLSLLKRRWAKLDRVIEGLPLVIVENGTPMHGRMAKARVDEDDVLAAARMRRGLERMEQIKYAVLERDGGISIVARDDPGPRAVPVLHG